MVSDISLGRPLGAARIGPCQASSSPTRPTPKMAESDSTSLRGNANDIVMYEGSAKEITEADFMPR